MSSLISSLAYMLQNSLLTENLFTGPPKVGNYSSLDSIIKKSTTTNIPAELEELEDIAVISKEAYKRTIMDGIKIPKSPTAAYNNNISNMVVDYLNKDISYDFLNK